ncbi:radical SAM/SPASM domain-containing protein [Aliarcobacter butzleri]|uniref:radical SAM/SPASM domain-containing protein n=1 Tax=Aliarcobacter butzleri TaxID=28197 RepID=UPI003AF926D5
MKLRNNIAGIIGYGNALKIKYFFEKPKPREIIIDISAACNAACPFCPRLYMPKERAKGYMDLELFKFILQEAKKEGIKNIRLYSTAEPTLHPEFDEIINLLKKENFSVSITTNASMLEKNIDALLKIDNLKFSIEGWDKESYEKYRYPLKFDKVYNNIKLFNEKRKTMKYSPKVSTNLLLTKDTDLNKYMNLWGDMIDEINIHFMLEATTYEHDKFISKKNEKILDKYYTFEKQKDNFLCSYPFNTLTVAFDGKIALCCNDFSASMNIGDIKEGIKRVFQSPVLNQIRNEFYTQNLDKCKGCSFFMRPYLEDVENIKKSIEKLEKKYKNKIHTSF